MSGTAISCAVRAPARSALPQTQHRPQRQLRGVGVPTQSLTYAHTLMDGGTQQSGFLLTGMQLPLLAIAVTHGPHALACPLPKGPASEWELVG